MLIAAGVEDVSVRLTFYRFSKRRQRPSVKLGICQHQRERERERRKKERQRVT